MKISPNYNYFLSSSTVFTALFTLFSIIKIRLFASYCTPSTFEHSLAKQIIFNEKGNNLLDNCAIK